MSYAESANKSQPTTRIASRIDAEIDRIKSLTDIVNSSTNRVTRHAHSLGFFEPQKTDAAGSAPTPVSISLSDALADLARAIDRNSGALNLFD